MDKNARKAFKTKAYYLKRLSKTINIQKNQPLKKPKAILGIRRVITTDPIDINIIIRKY